MLFAKEYIAVIDFEGINVNEAEAKALTQKLTSEIITLNKYTVVERSAMKRIIEEQKFQHSGCVDIQCAVDIGRILGAKYIIIGSVGKVGKTYSVDVRMIEVEIGESIKSANYIHKGEIDNLLIEGMNIISKKLFINPSRKNNQNINFEIKSYNSLYTCNKRTSYYFKVYKIREDGEKFYINKTSKIKSFNPEWNMNITTDNQDNMKLVFEIHENGNYNGFVIINDFISGIYDVKKEYNKDIKSLTCDYRKNIKKGDVLIKGQLKLEFF